MVTYVDERYLDVAFPEKEVKFGLAFVLAKNLITLENEELTKKVNENMALLKKYESIPRMLEYSSKALLPYQEYLE